MRLRRQVSFLILVLATAQVACSSSNEQAVDAFNADTAADDTAVADVPNVPDARDANDAIEDAPDIAGDLEPADNVIPDTPSPDVSVDVPPELRDPIFIEGCPVPGKAFARRATDPSFSVHGPDGIARPGDFLLANDRVAYVIESAEHRNAYYLYGGILVDAVAVDGCRQAGPERFQELGIMMGTLDLGAFFQSVLRAFSADTVEVVADGSDGGPAIVRASGTDDFFWLVEDELALAAFNPAVPNPRSQPLGLRIIIDYVLPPNSNVLQVHATFVNTGTEAKTLLAGCQTLFGLSTRITYFTDSEFSMGSFRLETEVPWVMASAGDGAWAFAMDGTNMATTNISGVTALIDLAQVVGGPLEMGPAGEEGDSATVTYYVATGPTDPNSAIRHLHEVNPTPVPDSPYTLRPLAGKVLERGTGTPIAGVTIDLEAKNSGSVWMVLDGFTSRLDGTFGGEIPDFGSSPSEYRLSAHLAGRPLPDKVLVNPSNPGTYDVVMDPAGTVCVTVTDSDGNGLPARVVLGSGSNLSLRIFPTGTRKCATIPPGEYDVYVTRGFEYSMVQDHVTVLPNQESEIAASLSRVVDTTGFMSVDTHCHAAPSPDNVIPIPERIRTVAGEGLEVVVSTDHEAVDDWNFGVVETGLQDWVATVVGQEVTATMPEHTTMLGVEPRPEVSARGDVVAWYGLDMQQVFEAIRARGARLLGLNHPRGWLNNIRYNVLDGTVGLVNPGTLGFPPNAQLFSFDMDMIELMNGTGGNVFQTGNTGMFDYWMSFQNLGHRITAVGSSDAHDYELPGLSRTFFASPTDQPSAFQLDDLVDAIHNGQAIVSLGAFARVTVDGAGLGETVTNTTGEVDLAVHIEAMAGIDVVAFRVYVNCDQVLEVNATAPGDVVKYDGTVKVPVTADAHVVVAGFGRNSFPGTFAWPWFSAASPRFVTNPIYVDVDGNGAFDPPGGKTCTYSVAPP